MESSRAFSSKFNHHHWPSTRRTGRMHTCRNQCRNACRGECGNAFIDPTVCILNSVCSVQRYAPLEHAVLAKTFGPQCTDHCDTSRCINRPAGLCSLCTAARWVPTGYSLGTHSVSASSSALHRFIWRPVPFANLLQRSPNISKIG